MSSCFTGVRLSQCWKPRHTGLWSAHSDRTYKWVNTGLVSGGCRPTGTCSCTAVTGTYSCNSSTVGQVLYDGSGRGSSYYDVGHAWPIYNGAETSTATEYTWTCCGLGVRCGGSTVCHPLYNWCALPPPMGKKRTDLSTPRTPI